MRTRLLFPDRDLDLDDLPEPDPDLVEDLELERLFAAMAAGDERVAAVVRRVLPLGVRGGDRFSTAPAVEAVRARQAVVADAIACPQAMGELYRLAADAVEAERRVWGGALRNAELVLQRSAEVLAGLLAAVASIRDLLARERSRLRSPALLGLADRLAADVDDAFLATARELLDRLGERTLVATAALGPGNRPSGLVLRREHSARARLRDRLVGGRAHGLVVDVALHDQNAMNALGELRAGAVAPAAAAVAESAGHLLAFCRRLRDETAFLVGCANLDAALRGVGLATAMPGLLPTGEPGLDAGAIADPCLALAIGGGVTGNDVACAGARLTVVTGANGGGKSTLLRAVGVARMLLAAGMPVAAASFRAAPADGIVAHFPRGEGGGTADGRLDADLRRLSELVDRVRPGSLALLNEPLSNVNERDGSAIVDGVVRGLVAAGVEVWLVTHHHELAAGLHARPPAPAAFLRAARGEGGARTYLVTPAPPLDTSFGADLWAAEIGPWPDGPDPGPPTVP